MTQRHDVPTTSAAFADRSDWRSVSAVIVAAGQGTRFGAPDKVLLPLCGRPRHLAAVVRAGAEALQGCGLAEPGRTPGASSRSRLVGRDYVPGHTGCAGIGPGRPHTKRRCVCAHAHNLCANDLART